MQKTFLPIWFILITNVLYASPFIDNELERMLKYSSDKTELKVIVRLRDSLDFSITMTHKYSRQLLIKQLKSNSFHSGENFRDFFKSNPMKKLSDLWLINGFAITADALTIRKLSSVSAVSSITLDKTFNISPPTYSEGSPSSWNISQINADILWSFGFTGSGIVVASMDTGVDVCNPHLSSSYRGGSNSWFDPTGIHLNPYDGIGHGTQTLGIILGSNNIDSTIGIATGAKWIAAKIFDDSGNATTSGIHLAFQWFLDPDGNLYTDDAPDIINCSWGIEGHINECIAEFQQDISILRQAGIAVIFAAGNENVNPLVASSISPANYPESLSVGAVDHTPTIASFSSRGPSPCDGSIFPKLVAPGISIETCDLSFGGIIDQHVFVEGTSFSAPHAAGGYALLMQAFPQINSLDIESALIASATDLGIPGPDNTYGNGQIDLYAAYKLLALNYCAADFDHNNSVNLMDLKILVDDWLKTGCSEQNPCRGDINSDYNVNLLDFSFLASDYKLDGQSCESR